MSHRDTGAQAAQSSADATWALTTAALSLGAGCAIAAIAIPGVRATTGVSEATAVIEGVARGLMVAVPLAVGLYARRRPAHARFGGVLVTVSCIWFLGLLSSSASPAVYSAGRVASWLAEVAIAYAVLAFPTGRLEDEGGSETDRVRNRHGGGAVPPDGTARRALSRAVSMGQLRL